MADKYSAVWVSHSSIQDYLQCPRAYYLKNIYRDPKTKHKIQLMAPPLALGSAVHEVLEALSVLPTAERFKESLIKKYERVWGRVSGLQGGFFRAETEREYKERGAAMLRRVMNNPGPLANKAVKITEKLPWFWLSEPEGLILCGKIDWLEYISESDQVHIIDFKTGKNIEKEDSLQLPIYYLLVHHCQHREVAKASYWYLESNDDLTPQVLPDLDEAKQRVLQIAQKIKTARKLEHFPCPSGEQGCPACRPYEMILQGKARLVGESEYGSDVYVLPPRDKQSDSGESSTIL